ncbi:MAG: hypothetical protein EBS29_04365 [Chloroflexia bacterium]|nr:hypothetical protein [Chloroflexia bacterium]
MAKAELVFVATIDGVHTFSNPGGIGRWLRAGHALQSHAIQALWANPLDPTMLIASSATSSWRSLDGGQQWQAVAMPAMQQFVASRTLPQRVFARDHTYAYLSHDAGATWQQLAYATDISAGGDTLWYGDATTSHHSHDGGGTWHASPTIKRLLLSNDGNQRLTMTHDNRWECDTQALPPAPTNWQATTILAGAPLAILGVAEHQLYAYHITWQISDPLIAPSVIHATTYHPDRVWVGDDPGTLWYSEQRGLAWQPIRTGLPAITAIASARLI